MNPLPIHIQIMLLVSLEVALASELRKLNRHDAQR